MADEQTPDAPELSPVEQQAVSMGWKPRDQYEGDPEKWVDASIFVARAPLFEKIDEQHRYNKTLKRELDVVKSTMAELKAHAENIRKTEFKRALEELKQAKRVALAEEDLLKAEDIQERIDTVREAQVAAETRPEPQPTQQPMNEAFSEWVTQNAWYKEDPEMREYADAIGIIEANKGNRSPDAVLKAVSEKVRKHFKDSPHFRNPMKDKAPPVETSGTAPSSSGRKSVYKPTPEERQIAKRFADQGIMTEDQYYEDLRKMKELE